MNSPTLCFLKCVLLFWVPWISIWIVGSACPFLQISQLSFWQAALNLIDQFGEYCHLNSIKSSNLWQWMTLHLFRSSFISFDHCTLFVALSVESITSPQKEKPSSWGFPEGKVGAPFPSQHFGKMIQREKGAQSVWETPKSLSLATGQGSPSDHSCLISCHNATSLTPWKRWKASRQLVTPAVFPSWKGKKVP